LARRLLREVTLARSVGVALAVLVSLTACSKAPATPPPSDTPASSPPASGSDGTTALTVYGKAPAASNGFSAIVIFESQAGGEMPPQTDVPYMDQVQQTFTPPVLLVRTGQPTEFRNHDDVLHNVRVRDEETRTPAFNVAIPTGEKYVFSFPRDGFYDVGCDIHPGMFAQIVSTSSPYATLADVAGNFEIDGAPPGAYKATVYAGGKKIEKDVQLTAGQTTLDFTQ
jgi:plastocyanin